MNVFKRLFKVGESEAHNLVDKLEDPIKMTEQGIRDLKKQLDESMKAYAEVKAMAIRSKREHQQQKQQAKGYEQKAVQLLQRAESGSLSPEEADRLASEVLQRKKQSEEQAAISQKNVQNLDGKVNQLDKQIKKLRSQISNFEQELKTLKARQKVSKATKTVNKQMSGVDTGSTVSMLERMKEKVEKEEALADAYGEMADENKSLDDEIDDALGGPTTGASDDLAALKAKLNKGSA